jgi:DNA-binding NarL/FixJ family response regulator
MNAQVRLLIFGKHEIFRKGIRWMASSFRWVEEIYEADTIEKTEDIASRKSVDMLIFDPEEFTEDCYGRCIELAKKDPSLKLVIMTGDRDGESIMTAAKSGIAAYLRKDSPPASLQQQLYAAANGSYVLDERLAGALYAKLIESYSRSPLSMREQEILECLKHRMSNRRIAEELNISLYTVKNHVSSIIHKLGVSSRFEIYERKELSDE